MAIAKKDNPSAMFAAFCCACSVLMLGVGVACFRTSKAERDRVIIAKNFTTEATTLEEYGASMALMAMAGMSILFTAMWIACSIDFLNQIDELQQEKHKAREETRAVREKLKVALTKPPPKELQEIAENVCALFEDRKQHLAAIKNQEVDEHRRELRLLDLDEVFETTVKSLFTTQENDHDSASASNAPVHSAQS